MIYDFIDKFKWIFFAAGLLIGPLELLVGAKIFGLTVFLLCFIVSGGLLVILTDVLFIQNDSNVYFAYFLLIICIILAGFISLVIVKIKSFGIIVCGGAAGFFLCILMNYLFLWQIRSTPSNLFFNNMLVILTILGAIFGYEFQEYIVIVSTSLIGSYITVRALSIIFGGFPNELQFNVNINAHVLDSLPWKFYVYFVGIVLLFGFGVYFQLQRRRVALKSIIKHEQLVNLLDKADQKI